MAEKGAKKKKSKADANVLASLPTTRPNRLGRHARGDAASAAATPVKAATPKPRAKAAAAKAAAKAKVKSKAAPKLAVAEAPAQKPRPVRSASKKLAEPARKSAAKRGPVTPSPEKAPSGTELVTTVVQAAGELASVGLSIGGQIVKRAVDRLPRP